MNMQILPSIIFFFSANFQVTPFPKTTVIVRPTCPHELIYRLHERLIHCPKWWIDKNLTNLFLIHNIEKSSEKISRKRAERRPERCKLSESHASPLSCRVSASQVKPCSEPNSLGADVEVAETLGATHACFVAIENSCNTTNAKVWTCFFVISRKKLSAELWAAGTGGKWMQIRGLNRHWKSNVQLCFWQFTNFRKPKVYILCTIYYIYF